LTTASPGPGLYPDVQLVTLSASEPATVYYTTDGNPPTNGGATTFSGPSPVTNILVDHPLNLRFFSVDLAGNEELPKNAQYSFDFDRPGLFLHGLLAGTYGFLQVVDVSFSSDEPVSYLVELGGTGQPGSGSQIGTGFLGTGQVAHVDLPCYLLELGQENPGNPVWIHVADTAGGVTSFEYLIETREDASVPIGGLTGDLELTPDGSFAYLLMPDLDQVWKIDVDPGSGSFHTVLAQIDVVAEPNSMDLTPDGSRLYVAGQVGYSEVDVASDAVTPIAMGFLTIPSGLEMHPTEPVAWVGADDGQSYELIVDPGDANYRVTTLLPLQSSFLERVEYAFSPDGSEALAAWSSDANYRLWSIRAEPGAGYATLRAQLVDALLPIALGTPAIDAAGGTGWATNEDGRLVRVALNLSPPQLGLANAVLGVRGMALVPDESVLLASGAPLDGLRVVDPTSLAVLANVASGGTSGTGTGRFMRFTPDGERAYVVRDQGAGSSELWMLWLVEE